MIINESIKTIKLDQWSFCRFNSLFLLISMLNWKVPDQNRLCQRAFVSWKFSFAKTKKQEKQEKQVPHEISTKCSQYVRNIVRKSTIMTGKRSTERSRKIYIIRDSTVKYTQRNKIKNPLELYLKTFPMKDMHGYIKPT